jgi:hypothetical protein
MHTQDETLEVCAIFPDVEGCPRLEVGAVLQLQLHCTWIHGHEARYRATDTLREDKSAIISDFFHLLRINQSVSKVMRPPNTKS